MLNMFAHFSRRTTPGASDAQSLAMSAETTCIAQVSISGIATVVVQGRLFVDFDWVDLDTFTASSIRPVTVAPFMRFVVKDLGPDGVVSAGLANV
jgi:hypothetical protein